MNQKMTIWKACFRCNDGLEETNRYMDKDGRSAITFQCISCGTKHDLKVAVEDRLPKIIYKPCEGPDKTSSYPFFKSGVRLRCEIEEKLKESQHYHRVCLHCGKDFITKEKGGRFCRKCCA